MRKRLYPDIGELGWSLYLSAHLRWLKAHTADSLAVMTSRDRRCLYYDSTDLGFNIPNEFYKKFNGERDCFGLRPRMDAKLRDYFNRVAPAGYTVPAEFNFGCNLRFTTNKMIYKPYEYRRALDGKKKILVFPRYRAHPAFAFRNLSRGFYAALIRQLCAEFPGLEIKTIGILSGAYNIDEVEYPNYMNCVRNEMDLQYVIDECQSAVAAIGGASSLPKISALQDVPTFIIGHEKKRCMIDENWMKARMGLHEILKDGYEKLTFTSAIAEKIIRFVSNEHTL